MEKQPADVTRPNSADQESPTPAIRIIADRPKSAIDYLISSITPTLALIALALAAFIFFKTQSTHQQIIHLGSEIEKQKAALNDYAKEINALKSSMAQHQSTQQELQKRHDQQMREVIQGVSQIQNRMKIFPTLDDVMYIPPEAVKDDMPEVQADPVEVLKETIQSHNNK